MRIGSPITGYGQESRNRAARQRIPNRIYTDENGVEHVEVTPCNRIAKVCGLFYIVVMFNCNCWTNSYSVNNFHIQKGIKH